MKKLLSLFACLAFAGLVFAADYSPQMYPARIYRVALGTGNAPSAADAAFVGIKPGDMVENTDDGTLFVMLTSNVYTKTTSAGVTSTSGGWSIGGPTAYSANRATIDIKPVALSAVSAITRQVLVNLGDITGNTAFGFGVTNQSSYGVMASFGRTAAAGANWDGNYDTGLDVRAINKLANDTAYNMRGAYIKAKNYVGSGAGAVTGVVGQIDGLTVECVADGTETESSVLKLGSDASTVTYGIDMDEVATPETADIRFSNGAIIKNGDANTLTITEAAVNVVGAFGASSFTAISGANSITNFSLNETNGTDTIVMYPFAGGYIIKSWTRP
jgi:hypothetical protein